jgi:hypothetical protein
MSDHHREHPEYGTLGVFAGYGDCDPKPYFVAAECGNDPCLESFCPYTHGEGWAIDGVEGLFTTPGDALAAFAERKSRA